MSTDNSFRLEVSSDGKVPTRLTLSGRVTVSSAVSLHAAAIEIQQNQHPVVIDCGKAEYIDAAAMQVLISLGRELAGDHIPCDLQGLDGPAAQSFRLCGVID
jgi:anti-anti-sigma regulatory factor